jgi:hypothetical protein
MKKTTIAISILTALTGIAVASAQPGKGECGGGERGAHHFEKLDANGDKVVTKAELISGATKHFDLADANKDGSVTPAERKAAHEKFAAERFAESDKNKDGALSGDELPPHFAHKLDKLDANKDGKLTKDELALLKAKHEEREGKGPHGDKVETRAELTAHLTERFTKLDTNQDGKLTAEEMQKGHGHRGHHERGDGEG